MKTKILTTLVALLSMIGAANIHARERDTLGVGTQTIFVENKGQWHPNVRYAAQMHNAALFLEEGGMTIALRSQIEHPAPATLQEIKMHAYRMHFVGANGSPYGDDPLPGYNNYYLGSDPTIWQSHVPTYSTTRYHDLYDDIDLEIYSASDALKYNFIVHPHADAKKIRIEYIGTGGVSISHDGNLRIRTSVRDIVEMKPYSYQLDADGKEKAVGSRWSVKKSKEGYIVGIELEDYDHRKDLVIDPVVHLIFSTYTGSTADNWGTTGTYDSYKNTYTAGLVFDIGYPTSVGAYDTIFHGTTTTSADIGIFKFDSTGTQRLYATYLGGNNADMPHSMYVNAFDELLIFGTTGSNNFPTTVGSYQRALRGGTEVLYESVQSIAFPEGSDIFISRFSPDGTRLQASTLIGGSKNDGLNYQAYYDQNTIMKGNDTLYYNYGDGARGEIMSDDLGNIYIGSTTFSTDFPTTPNSIQPTSAGRQEGVVFKFDYSLSTLLWSTYIGGSEDDAVYSIDLDEEGNVYFCGGTTSSDLRTTDLAYQNMYNGGTADGFVGKIEAEEERLDALTYFGSASYDQIYFVRAGKGGDIFLFGQTHATGSTMIYNANYGVPGSGMLMARMLPDLSERRWSTVFGTPGRINLSPTAFSADICNRVYAAGWGRDFAGRDHTPWYRLGTAGMETTPDAYSDSTDGQDFYIVSLTADAGDLFYATFFGELHDTNGRSTNGGDHVDGGTSRFDRLATLYQSVCASCGGSQHFPTTADAWCATNRASNCNNAIFRFNVTNDFPVADFAPPEAGCAPYTVSFHNMGRGSTFAWDFGDGATSSEANPTHTYTEAGTYTITLTASTPGACATSDTLRHTVLVLSPAGNHSLQHLLACNGDAIQIGFKPALSAQYEWLTGIENNINAPIQYVDREGEYVLRTHVDGCSQTDTFHVRTRMLIKCELLTPISCHDSADGTQTYLLVPQTEMDSISFSLTPTLPYTTTDSTITYTNVQPEQSYAFHMEGYGCTFNSTFSLPNKPVPKYDKETSAVLCTDSCAGWIHFQISTVDTLIENLCEGVHISNLTAPDGCPVADTTLILREHTLDSLHIWTDKDVIHTGEEIHLQSTLHSNPNVHYAWTPIDIIDRPTAASPIAIPEDTLTCFTLTATTENCTATAKTCVRSIETICDAPIFTIPNAFTPNSDGINDAICFNSDPLLEFYIAIFNRWGEKVYESTDPDQCWDGTYKSNPAMAGVYTYTCRIKCFGEIENHFQGDITLIR